MTQNHRLPEAHRGATIYPSQHIVFGLVWNEGLHPPEAFPELSFPDRASENIRGMSALGPVCTSIPSLWEVPCATSGCVHKNVHPRVLVEELVLRILTPLDSDTHIKALVDPNHPGKVRRFPGPNRLRLCKPPVQRSRVHMSCPNRCQTRYTT